MARRRLQVRTALVTLVALLATLLVAGTTTTVPSAEAAPSGKVTGRITAVGSGDGVSRLKVSLFDRHWNFLRARKANRAGVYSFGPLAPGRYWVQVTDRRPTYDVTKFASTQVKVRVRGGRTTVRHLRVRRGAAITGTVTAGRARAARAKVVATNQYGGAYEVRANERGEFALGGLSEGNYSVFAYDRRGSFTGRSVWVPGMKPGGTSHIAVRMTTSAGGLVVDLYAGRSPLRAPVWVTAVNRATGQYWVARARRGQVTLAGLSPGRYRIAVPGAGQFLARTGPIGKVRAGKYRFTSFRLNRRGGWFTGGVVDAVDGTPLPGVTVSVYDGQGSQRGRVKTRAAGGFRVGGSFGNEKGLTVVVEVPGGVEGQKYKKVTLTGVRSVAGRGIDLGAIALARAKG